MKSKLLTFFLPLLLTSLSWANDLQVGDVNFFQKSQSILLDTGFRYEIGKANKDTDTSATIFSNHLRYGFFDNFNTGLQFDYALSSKTEPDGSDSISNPGMSDVVITNRYRAINRELYLDFLADLTVSIGDQKIGNSEDDGSYNNGANGIALGVFTGQKKEAFQWRAGLRLDYFDEKYYTELANEELEKYLDSVLNITLSTQVQYRATSEFSLIGGFDLTYMGEKNYEREIDDGGTQDTEYAEKAHTLMSLSVAGMYNFSSSTAVKFSVAHTPNYSYDTTYQKVTPPAGSKVESEVEGVSNTKLALTGIFLF